ncbi:MAG: hypothetical protein ACYCTV_01785 [Leptospirales bacterium]
MDRTGLENQIRKIGGDPDFVFFLFDSSFPINKSTETISNSSQEKAAPSRKIKRQIQKQRPENWKPCWDEMKKILKAGRGPLYSLETRAGFRESFGPASRMPGGYGFREIQEQGSPVDLLAMRQWGAIWLLTTYFRRVSGRPCWKIVADLVNAYLREEKWDYFKIQIPWQDQKKDFETFNPETFLEGPLELFRSYSGNPTGGFRSF